MHSRDPAHLDQHVADEGEGGGGHLPRRGQSLGHVDGDEAGGAVQQPRHAARHRHARLEAGSGGGGGVSLAVCRGGNYNSVTITVKIMYLLCVRWGEVSQQCTR